jgi:hypothetical protein
MTHTTHDPFPSDAEAEPLTDLERAQLLEEEREEYAQKLRQEWLKARDNGGDLAAAYREYMEASDEMWEAKNEREAIEVRLGLRKPRRISHCG